MVFKPHDITADGQANLIDENFDEIFEAVTGIPTSGRVQVINGDTVTLLPGTPVYLSGSSGHLPVAFRAQANATGTMPTAGLVTESIPPRTEGMIQSSGILTPIDLQGFATGDVLYVSAATSGTLTATAPTTLTQKVGVVLLAQAQGSLLVMLGSPATTNTLLDGANHTDTASVAALEGTVPRANATPAWTRSTFTIPDTFTASNVVYASSTNTLAGLATANSGVLVTSGAGVPSISSTLPTAVQDNITRLGTLVAGAVPASLVTAGTFGAGAYVMGTSLSTPSLLSTAAITMTPAAGSNLNVNLSGTGDFAVNTNQLYVDTNVGVGLGTATPSQELDLIGNFELETTTSSGTGVIYKGASRFLHNFNAASSDGLNTFIGIGAGNFTMSPAGGIVTLASYNTVIGHGTFPVNTTGYYNTAIGAQALQNNTTGYSNTGVGLHALQNNITGFRNTGIGTAALALNTTGIYNTADGFNALYQNTTGSENTAFGALAATSNTTGARNTVAGVDALSNNTTGVRNTVMGMQALFDLDITAADGTSGNHVAIGYNTGRGVTTGTNNTIIGANVTGLAATLSNNIIIADGAGNQRIRILNTGYVGLGTAAPQVKLHVTGSSATAWNANNWAADVALVVGNTNTTDNNFSELRFTTWDDVGDSFTAAGRIGTIFTSHANAAVSGELFFATNNAGTFGERVRIASVGIGIGTTTFPSAGTAGLVLGDGTALSGMGLNTAGIFADDLAGTVVMRGIWEDGTVGTLGLVVTKTDTGDPTGHEGLFAINTFDNTFKVYADAAWRTLASGW